MVGLLQFALANLDDIGKIPANVVKQLASDSTLAEEEAVKWIWVVARLFGQCIQGLDEVSVTRQLVRATYPY